MEVLRRPLQPKSSNIQWNPKPKPIGIEKGPGKENHLIEAFGPLDASLAEELRVARERRERLRVEREKTERLMREREGILERGFREMERRWEEQKKMELEIQRIIWFMDLRSCVRVGPMKSLRAGEEEERDAKLKEQNCAKSKGPEQPSLQEKMAKN
ncbi:uncharacterized protein A4U43_C07F6780 [Asparagus officinalis]|uniref:Uncharacterized protein n=1 Tax=Asparagus officinalis TaxID=4686 RepID=A0A5P1EA97_ASPOF|nr:high mobility group B protein 6 [Asparagus officinalis]ONK62673.1 uncharacterized protein A4U43_C07F6780 [Asparagus officinalis]